MYSVLTTVVDQASSYDLTVLANVKAELSITVTDNDTLLGRYITSASRAASQYCDRVFVVEGVQDQFFAVRDSVPFVVRQDVLQLSRWPVEEMTSVVVDGTTLTENTDFITDPTNGQLTRIDSSGNKTSWYGQLIAVNYEAGYDEIPGDIEDAVIKMVTARYLAKGRDKNIKQDNIPGLREVQYWIATGTEAGNMTPDVVDILDQYRVPAFA